MGECAQQWEVDYTHSLPLSLSLWRARVLSVGRASDTRAVLAPGSPRSGVVVGCRLLRGNKTSRVRLVFLGDKMKNGKKK